jgi:YidC/Oxa1 family membrane protein insertase
VGWLIDPISGIMQMGLTYCYNATVALGIPNYGLAIIILTIAIKVILYPLTVKQVRSMKAMQDLSPKLKALQEKYKDNKEKLNAEVAKLYKESGVNPLAGCLPLLIQMPFLIAIFFAIREYNYVSDPSFLWIKDLSQSTPSDPYYILPVLAAATTWISTKQTGTDPSQQNKMMQMFMPLFIGYITISFPAGLGLYWVVSNVVQIVQQWWLYRGKAKPEGARKP